MTLKLDLADIQGNLLSAYGRIGFPTARCVLLHVNEGKSNLARKFLNELRFKVTTAELWQSSKTKNADPIHVIPKKPNIAINVAFTFNGLVALGVPVRTLRSMPEEFQEGMLARSVMLNDAPNPNITVEEIWDHVWTNERNDKSKEVHVLVTFNVNSAAPAGALDHEYNWLVDNCGDDKGVKILTGHRGPSKYYQDISAIMAVNQDQTLTPTSKEHFGFTDGIGDPVFEGQVFDINNPQEALKKKAIGQGKLNPDQTWSPLATGEFLLGHPDESQEIAGFAMPIDFSRNGTFMAYRKIHQNPQAFSDYIAKVALIYSQTTGLSVEQADETIRAKMAGRWSDGIPLMKAPTYSDWQALRAQFNDKCNQIKSNKSLNEQQIEDKINSLRNDILVNFTYSSDLDGSKCPFSSHLRRSNPREMLDPATPTPGFSTQPAKSSSNTSAVSQKSSSILNNRHRILRRGLPYGKSGPGIADSEEHGILMMTVCSSLFRQFEFIQQQWLQYGLDFNSGNDTCPLLGNHDDEAKFVIPADANSGKPPFICDQLPQFVETRGGAYFFIPSMTSLRMIAEGLVDPT